MPLGQPVYVACSNSQTDIRQFLHLPKTNAILPDPEDATRRRVLLSATSIEAIPAATKAYLDEIGATLSAHEVVLGWEHWNAREYAARGVAASSGALRSGASQGGGDGRETDCER